MTDKRKPTDNASGQSSKAAKKMKAKQSQSGGTDGPVPVDAYHYAKGNVLELALAHPDETWVLYDGEHAAAILAPNPRARAHTVIVLKQPAATLLDDVPQAALVALAVDTQAVARALVKATGCAGGGRGRVAAQPHGQGAGAQ